MDSHSFDRAASFYDQTRHLPEPVAVQGIQAILELAGPGARILEVGAGTGRIGVPLLLHGADWFGCDLSPNMMARMHLKFPAAPLARADAARLPYPTASFDALLTVHVMHLVGPWREALREFRRVLKSGGVYLNAYTERSDETPNPRIRRVFHENLAALGYEENRPGVRDDAYLHDELIAMGANLQAIEAVVYSEPVDTPRKALDSIAARTHSHTWDIPDEIFTAALVATQRWAAAEFPNPDVLYVRESRFIIDAATF